jgi:hypothetical protein
MLERLLRRRRRDAEDPHRPLRQQGVDGDVRERLRVRVVLGEDMPASFEVGARRPVAEDLDAVLVADLPDRLEVVSPEALDRLGLAPDEALDAALAATERDAAALPDERERNDEGAEVVFLRTESPWAASELLWPERRLGDLGEHGAVFAVPNEAVIAMHAITDARVTGVLAALAPWAGQLYFLEPGSVSPHLYWWTRDGVRRLPARLANDSASLSPPPEFLALLERLGADVSG